MCLGMLHGPIRYCETFHAMGWAPVVASLLDRRWIGCHRSQTFSATFRDLRFVLPVCGIPPAWRIRRIHIYCLPRFSLLGSSLIFTFFSLLFCSRTSGYKPESSRDPSESKDFRPVFKKLLSSVEHFYFLAVCVSNTANRSNVVLDRSDASAQLSTNIKLLFLIAQLASCMVS